ncbi:MAG TPA: Ig-like domain-containing protein, partial [Kofleriaceae bacterium]
MQRVMKIAVLVAMVSASSACTDTDNEFSAGPLVPLAYDVFTPQDTPVDAVIFEGGDLQISNAVASPHQVTVDGGTLHVVPMPGYVGSFEVTYDLGDGGRTDHEELWVHVQRSDDDLQPHADDLDVTFHGRKDLTLPAHYGVGGNSLPDLFTFKVVTSPTHGALSGTGQLRTYTPNAAFVGDDAFTFTVTFAGSTSKPATMRLHVTAGSAPSASDLSISL